MARSTVATRRTIVERTLGYINLDACAAVLHLWSWITIYVSGRTQPPLRVMIGFRGVIRLAAITSIGPIRLV